MGAFAGIECRKCGLPRERRVRNGRPLGWRCRPCENAAGKAARDAYYQANKERWAVSQARRVANGKYRDAYLRRQYGITSAEYDTMHEAQSGLCAICAQPETRMIRGQVMALCVDHDHETGAVRALLCHACNTLIGHAQEDREILLRAVAYLGVHVE